jgi:hypothetical protein
MPTHKIRVRRGLKSELDQIYLSEGELGYTTDTGEVWIGSGIENILCGSALVDTIANRPPAGISGRIFEATDQGLTYIDNGAFWRIVGLVSLDETPDGTIYGKVRLTELDSGRLKQIRALSGNVAISGDEIYQHLSDHDKHREIDDTNVDTEKLWSSSKIDSFKADKVFAAVQNNIATLNSSGNLIDSGLKKNDTGIGTQDLWSANKIQNEIEAHASGLSWQNPVIVFKMISDANQEESPPQNPEIGDAYVVFNWGSPYINNEIREWNGVVWNLIAMLTSGTRVIFKASGCSGSFSGNENKIGEYNGTEWIFNSPIEGWATLVVGDGSVHENSGYTYSSSNWLQFTGAGQITAGIGIIKDGNRFDINLGAGIKELPTDEIGLDLQQSQGLKLTSTDAEGQLAIDYDDSTLGIVNSKLSVKNNGIGENEINNTALSDGLTGGSGQPIMVDIGLGLQIISNQVSPKHRTNGALIVDSSGVGLNVDGTGLVIVNNILQMNIIDGGAFLQEEPTIWYSVWSVGATNSYWDNEVNALWGGTYFYNDSPTNYTITPAYSWNIDYRPTKMRITYLGNTVTALVLMDTVYNVIQIINGPISSGQGLDLTISEDIGFIRIETGGSNSLYNIEFNTELPS